MPINKTTGYGQIRISDNAIASIAGSAVIECYGVVGVTPKNPIKDGFNDLLKKENYSKGVIVRNKNGILDIDLFIIVCYGVKISEVVNEAQKRVKYNLEKNLNMDINSVNVYVEGIKVVD